jgi:hypothetical protein
VRVLLQRRRLARRPVLQRRHPGLPQRRLAAVAGGELSVPVPTARCCCAVTAALAGGAMWRHQRVPNGGTLGCIQRLLLLCSSQCFTAAGRIHVSARA